MESDRTTNDRCLPELASSWKNACDYGDYSLATHVIDAFIRNWRAATEGIDPYDALLEKL